MKKEKNRKSFHQLSLNSDLLKAMDDMKFEQCTEIQEKTIEPALKGKDIIAQAMTGSGKTAAFGLPVLEKIEKGKSVQSIILTPTRELAVQIAGEMKKFAKYTKHHIALVYGGVAIGPQMAVIKKSEIIVGTPGRVLDHMSRRTLDLSKIKILVLDEADRMLDMGFVDDVERIIRATPHSRQTLLFSATMPEPVARLAQRYMKHPLRFKTEQHISTARLKHIYYDVDPHRKNTMLEKLLRKEKPDLALIFCATRDRTDMVSHFLQRRGIKAKALHGGHAQEKRTRIMEGFHEGRVHVLVATDVAARGLHIEGITHVFNYDVPNTVQDYTHRVGRTARFKEKGKAITLLAKRDHDAFRKIAQKIDIEKGRMGR